MSEMAYIGRAPCGCVGAAMVDRPDYKRENAKEIAALVRDGWTVERVTVEATRGLLKSCPHDPKWGRPVKGKHPGQGALL